ncbi:hypothetical protein BGX34_000174 [Mortierella sp. NVP85]|nr:hypothetical protein BGX34_000174 [Mortierella sp. NVP85]
MSQDAQVASQYLNDHPVFYETARFWTEFYAKPTADDLLRSGHLLRPPPSGDGGGQSNGAALGAGSNHHTHQPLSSTPTAAPEPILTEEELEKRRKVQDLVEMGFEADKARTFLIRAKWSTEAALEDLLNA